MNFAAAIPAYNAATTLPTVLAALRAQAPAPTEIIVIDDGSTDDTPAVARQAGVRIVELGMNLGRGAARTRAMSETDTPLVLMCDTTMQPMPDFTTRALSWFADECVAAVFGHVTQPQPRTVADRWRGRHLFKLQPLPAPRPDSLLATSVCVLRRTAVEAVGGFDSGRRAGEDADLGRRLLAAGWKVVADPALRACSLTRDSVPAVLARYARWHSPDGLSAIAFLRQLVYAVKVMAWEDLRDGDPAAALLSLASPFYQLRRR